MLQQDIEPLLNSTRPEPRLLLLGPHDPYLEQRDRKLILPDSSLHKTVWRTISNPGVILRGGQIIGIWQHKSPEIKLQAFEPLSISEKQHLQKLIEALLTSKTKPAYSSLLRGQKLKTKQRIASKTIKPTINSAQA